MNSSGRREQPHHDDLLKTRMFLSVRVDRKQTGAVVVMRWNMYEPGDLDWTVRNKFNFPSDSEKPLVKLH